MTEPRSERSTEQTLALLADEMAALRVAHAAGQAQIAELRAELAQLRGAVPRGAMPAALADERAKDSARDDIAPDDIAPDDIAADDIRVTSRRRLFALAGGAAAAAVALGTASSVGSAAAADGDSLKVGQLANATISPPSRTQLNYSATAGPVDNYFLVTDGPSGDGALFSSAIGGYAYLNVSTGIYGYSHQLSGNGVFGLADGDAASYGLWGRSATGTGVVGQSYSGFDFAGRGSGRMYLDPHVGSGPPISGSHTIGELVRDSNGDWWVSYQTGIPGKWRKLGGGTTAGALHVLNPTRVYDSRNAGSGGRMAAGTVRVVSVANGISLTTGAIVTPDIVPAGATAIAFNLTIAAPQGSGYLCVAPGSAATFTASSINWGPTTGVLANGTLVQLDSARQVKVFANGGSTDFIIDVTGYYL